MKTIALALCTVFSVSAWAQQDTATHTPPIPHESFEYHTVLATASVGFVDNYRTNYSFPTGFVKNNTSGFAPIMLKLEYALGKNLSLGATFGYDAFNYNFSQEYQGNNGPFIRYKTDAFRLFSGGVAAFYHLHRAIKVRNLDPFVGLGLSLNNIRNNAYPSGDSTTTIIDHTVTPYLKVGARYYISSYFSLFADLGYEKQSVFSLGFSARFFSGKEGIK